MDDFYSVNLSNCCNSPVLTSHGDEGTNSWRCSRCKEPCDARNVVRYTASTTLYRPKPWGFFHHLGVCASITGVVLVLSMIFVLLAGKAS